MYSLHSIFSNPTTAMSQILDPIPASAASPLRCSYVNATSEIQVARITNVENWYFERVVFPGQRLAFEAVPEALLEIHTGMMASAILSDTIPCEHLCEGFEAAEVESAAGAAAPDPAGLAAVACR